MSTTFVRFRLRRNLQTRLLNIVLLEGEPAFSTDTQILKIGDGIRAWKDLPVITGGGLQGPRGLQGIQGVQGIQGQRGDIGLQGIQGPQGIEGPAGIRGEKGDDGPQGVQGLQGIQGPQGIEGPIGEKGEKGNDGPQGVQGLQGIQGPQGIEGPAGIQGEKGDTGPQGVQGLQGIRGIEGPTGPAGSSRVTGSWTLAPGANEVSFTLDMNGAYSIWVNGNIPNGIIVYTATVVVTNSNVPVIGSSYAWNYTGGGSPLLLTSIPSQIVGTPNTISTSTAGSSPTNKFTFVITNNSGSSQVVNYGYTTL